MADNIRDAALELGYVDARPITGHPFDVWRNRLNSIPLGKHLSFEHDPANASGWPLEEITIWVAVAPTPPLADWPDGCGEFGAYYMHVVEQDKRLTAWEDAAVAMGYELKNDVMLPERAAAIRAGLGVHGLNGLLIAPRYGSFINIDILLLHAAPPADARGPEHDLSPGCCKCGDCIRGCPTGAISDDGVNTLICLRTYMNWPDFMSEGDYPKMGRRILGCDTCQQLCPHNAELERVQPPADMAECMKLENLLTKPDTDCMAQYVTRRFIPDKRIMLQASLAAANTDRKDLLPLIGDIADTPANDENEQLLKVARWSADRLRTMK